MKTAEVGRSKKVKIKIQLAVAVADHTEFVKGTEGKARFRTHQIVGTREGGFHCFLEDLMEAPHPDLTPFVAHIEIRDEFAAQPARKNGMYSPIQKKDNVRALALVSDVIKETFTCRGIRVISEATSPRGIGTGVYDVAVNLYNDIRSGRAHPTPGFDWSGDHSR